MAVASMHLGVWSW